MEVQQLPLPSKDNQSIQADLTLLEKANNKENESEADTSIYFCTVPSTTITTHSMEEQKQQLFGICETIQVQLRGALERIGKIIRWIEASSGEPISLLEEYQKVWPIIVDADMQIKLLSNTVRQTIDACSINEHRLKWLLSVHKFQMSIEEMLEALTTFVNDDIERVLSLYVRCGKGRISGLRLKARTIDIVQLMQEEIRTKSFRS